MRTGRQIIPCFGVPRKLDGLACHDSSVAHIDNTVFAHTLDDGVSMHARARALVTRCRFCNSGVALEASGETEAAVEHSLFSGCGNSILAHAKTKLLVEGNRILCTKLGVAMHGACTVVIRENMFSSCRDGVLYSGGDPLYQTVEFCNNSVVCTPPKVSRYVVGRERERERERERDSETD